MGVEPDEVGGTDGPDEREGAAGVNREERALADAQLYGGPTLDPFTKAAEPDISGVRVRRTAAALAGGQHKLDQLPEVERRALEDVALRKLRIRGKWSPRTLRATALGLAQADGHGSLSRLTPPDREAYEDRAAANLQRRKKVRELRAAILAALDGAGVKRSRRTVEQFVARHANDTDAGLRVAAQAYLEGRGALPRMGVRPGGASLVAPGNLLLDDAPSHRRRGAREHQPDRARTPQTGRP